MFAESERVMRGPFVCQVGPKAAVPRGAATRGAVMKVVVRVGQVSKGYLKVVQLPLSGLKNLSTSCAAATRYFFGLGLS